MHTYRSHSCGELRPTDVGHSVRVSGWVHRKRDHGGLLFIDLRDHHGLTQCVVEPENPHFEAAERASPESVVRIEGPVVRRSEDTVNPSLDTGEVEVRIEHFEILSAAAELPMQVFGEQIFPEETRLTYRFLDLRREKLHANFMLRG